LIFFECESEIQDERCGQHDMPLRSHDMEPALPTRKTRIRFAKELELERKEVDINTTVAAQ
jgi:hypothetical protein